MSHWYQLRYEVMAVLWSVLGLNRFFSAVAFRGVFVTDFYHPFTIHN